MLRIATGFYISGQRTKALIKHSRAMFRMDLGDPICGPYYNLESSCTCPLFNGGSCMFQEYISTHTHMYIHVPLHV